MNENETRKILGKPIKDIIILPDREWRYQCSIHLSETNKEEFILTRNDETKCGKTDNRKDKRYDLDYCRRYFGRATRRYILSSLNPNRSKCLFFSFAIVFERSSSENPYHLHLAMTDVQNHQFFISKKGRDFLANELGVFAPEELTEDHKIRFFNNLFHTIHYREYPGSSSRKMIMDWERTFNMKEKNKKDIEQYLSKSKFQYSWNPDWASGFDETNSVLLHKDLKR